LEGKAQVLGGILEPSWRNLEAFLECFLDKPDESYAIGKVLVFCFLEGVLDVLKVRFT